MLFKGIIMAERNERESKPHSAMAAVRKKFEVDPEAELDDGVIKKLWKELNETFHSLRENNSSEGVSTPHEPRASY